MLISYCHRFAAERVDQTLSPTWPRKGAEKPGMAPKQPGTGQSWASPSRYVGEGGFCGGVCCVGEDLRAKAGVGWGIG